MISKKLELVARALDVLADVGPMNERAQRQIAANLRDMAEEVAALEAVVAPMRCRGPLPEGVVSITGRRRPTCAPTTRGGGDAA
ncbi:MAG: hypothetical protein M0006_16015 [Magnetospirillum sp.]|nr:hypothetical protein [Magnetospirillum sp.]